VQESTRAENESTGSFTVLVSRNVKLVPKLLELNFPINVENAIQIGWNQQHKKTLLARHALRRNATVILTAVPSTIARMCAVMERTSGDVELSPGTFIMDSATNVVN
jgi:hypothetical protein